MMDEEIIEKKRKQKNRKHFSPFDPGVHALVADSALFTPTIEYIPGKWGKQLNKTGF